MLSLLKAKSNFLESMENNPKKEKEGVEKVAHSFTTKELTSILEMLEKYEVKEFCLERSGEKLSLKRGQDYAPIIVSQPVATTPAVATTAQPQYAASPASTLPLTRSAVIEEANVVEKKVYKEIISPMVGSFYRRPAVDAEPYVQVGDTVKKGDVLCIIEAMKLMNEIESEVSGKIVEICIEDGHMVEYGEVLLRIE